MNTSNNKDKLIASLVFATIKLVIGGFLVATTSDCDYLQWTCIGALVQSGLGDLAYVATLIRVKIKQ